MNTQSTSDPSPAGLLAGRPAGDADHCPEPGCTADHYPHDPDDYGHGNPCGCDWNWTCDMHRRTEDA